MEHRIEACSFVQILDAPVPQGGNQLVEAFRDLDLHIPELVIEVPKISSSPRRSRRRRVPLVQTAEQLVQVPTIVSYSSFHGLVKQYADIPVPHGRGGQGGGRSLQGLHQDRIQQRFVEQSTLTFQFLLVVAVGEVFTAFAQYEILLPHPRTRLVLWLRIFTVFFELFHKIKKSEVGFAFGVGTAPRVEPIHAAS